MNKHIGSSFEEFLAEDCTEAERKAMARMATIFASKRADNLKLILNNQHTMELPGCAVSLISDALIQLAAGNSVTLQVIPQKTVRTKFGDPNTSTDRLVTYFREYHEGLAMSGECIDNDCDVVSKPYAKIISERLEKFQKALQHIKEHQENSVKGIGPQMSATWNIANNALKAGKKDD